MIITTPRYALRLFFITSYPTRPHGIIVKFSLNSKTAKGPTIAFKPGYKINMPLLFIKTTERNVCHLMFLSVYFMGGGGGDSILIFSRGTI